MTFLCETLLLVSLCFSPAASFGSSMLPHLMPFVSEPHLMTAAVVSSSTASVVAATASAHSVAANSLLATYSASLAAHPLATKMITGGVLSVTGDAIAQSREPDEYDTRRAVSFMVFDMTYRALQHNIFPIIGEVCRGQFFLAAAASISPVLAASTDPFYFAAMERTLASQLGVVPFMYYPAFFALTGVVQGLSAEGTVERAKEKFIPLMKRNLLFWIPVQFVQFGFVEDGLQIPFLSLCGLMWTVILSAMAGSTAAYNEKHVALSVMEEERNVNLEGDVVIVR